MIICCLKAARNARPAMLFGILLLATARLTGAEEPAAAASPWPALKALDDLAERGEALVDLDQISDLRMLAPTLRQAALKTAGESLPATLQNPEAVHLLQEDLRSLAELLAQPDRLSDEDLRSAVSAIHPVVEKTMETAGMPHVHDHSEAPPAEVHQSGGDGGGQEQSPGQADSTKPDTGHDP